MSGSRHPRRPDGYTLLEVMLAVALFAVLCGGIFGVVQSALGSVAAAKAAARVRTEDGALLALLRQACARLPLCATVHAEAVPGALGARELELRTAPGVFQWGRRWQDPMEVTLSLGARQQADGRWELGLRKCNPSAKGPGEAELLAWLPLAGGLAEIEWTFYDPQDGSWKREWKDPLRRPPAIALRLRRPGEADGGTRTVFALPQVKADALPRFAKAL